MQKNFSILAHPSAWQERDSFSRNNNRNTQKLHLIFTTKHFLSFFVRLSLFFPHRLFTNSEYYRDIKKTITNFFDRFFSYFPLSKPTSGRFLFCIASQSRYCVDFMTWFFYFKVISEKIKAIYFFKATKNRDYSLGHIWK